MKHKNVFLKSAAKEGKIKKHEEVRRAVVLLAAFGLLCVLPTGCGDADSQTENLPLISSGQEPNTGTGDAEDTKNIENTENAESGKPGNEVPDTDPDALSEAELAELAAFFNQEGDGRIRNVFLNCSYEDPGEINLYSVFCCGVNGSGGASQAPRDEVEALAAAYPDFAEHILNLDVHKITFEEMNAVYCQYTGVQSLDESQKLGLEQFLVLPEGDAYYTALGGTNLIKINVISASHNSDGHIIMQYTTENGTPGEAVLQKTDDGYLFLSNRLERNW